MRLKWRWIKSSYGRCRAPVEMPFGGSKIFCVMQRHTLVNEAGKRHAVPAGACYVANDELAERTKDRVMDQLVLGGLYDLLRMCGHIGNGAVREGENLAAYIADVRGAADQLRLSGYMDDEMCGQLLERVAVLKREMELPKRADAKITAAARLATAERLRRDGGRRRIAPAARCAYAAAQHVAKRLDGTVFGVNRYFSAQTVRVCRVILDQEMAIRRAWEFFMNMPSSGGGETDAWDRERAKLERSGAPRIREVLGEHQRAFDRLELRPYRALASAVSRHLRDLDATLERGDLKGAGGPFNALTRTLRRMVMIRVLERDLIGRVSVIVEARQRKRFEPFPSPAYRERFTKIADRVARLTYEDLDPEVLLATRLGFESASTHLAREAATDHKNALKSIVDDLGSVSLTGQQNLPFERAS